ncbi:KAP family P-loop NTPase fold protein [Pseudoalteromonas sp. T1lg22]|uniref:KAP family P-loop NTPase fold protein n=1 Tax=Pseudoalteromonas sp. T1lg22 TaxID=2077096 RepID=UPI000CF73D3E|nr:P-loop NTPase fold protein [Pseudoalteromonas sp. T1lg22]
MTLNTPSPITNCKYKNWFDDYTFDTCKLNRREYGEFIASYIAGEQDGFVLNLNGAWGTGKTQFLRRLYSLLCERGYPTVYIDAWESDFSEIPLSVVASELINQLSMINENIGNEFEKVQQFLGKALKGTIVGGAGLLTKHLLDEASVGTEAAKALFEKTDQDYLKDIMGNHVEQVEAIKDIRDQLALLAEVLKQNFSYELPVVVLVDELDRCRPNYAIEMLEVIKHFFTTKNFVFVVATDSEQLEHSIKAVYGSSFDSSLYLKRFFDREAKLNEPDLSLYLRMQRLNKLYESEGLIIYPLVRSYLSEDGLNDFIEWLARAYKLSIRDVDQLVAKLQACLRYAQEEYKSTSATQYINIFTLLIALIDFDRRFREFSNEGNYIDDAVRHRLTNTFVGRSNAFDKEERTRLSDFIDTMKHCSKMHWISARGDFGRVEEKEVFGTHSHVHFKPKGGLSIAAFEEVADAVSYFSTGKRKGAGLPRFWLWDDYVKLAQLAGRLD